MLVIINLSALCLRNPFIKKNKNKGFTLLELLIVISIIAILSVALVIVLNPAETLRKARDSQRISDLNTLKTAIGLYMTTVNPTYLGGASNAICKTAPETGWASPFKISYSYPIADPITDIDLDGSTVTTVARQAAVSPGLTDGTGWIPVNFDGVAGGSPISNIPVDPVNTITDPASVRSTDLVYRYGCAVTPLTFEIDAVLESTAYGVGGTDDKSASDGGNSTLYYETGTNLKIFSAASPSTIGTDI